MPIINILSVPGSGASGPPATLTANVRTAVLNPASLTVTVNTKPERRPATLTATVQTFNAVQPATLTATVNTAGLSTPTQVIQGEHPIITTASVTGLPGDVISWQYSHTGQYEELQVTVLGLHGLAMPTASLTATGTQAGRVVGQLPTRTFQVFGQEPELDVGANTTSFHFRNSFDLQLRGTRLPELIPWRITPTPDPCLGTRQRVNVSSVVNQAMTEAGITDFSLESDPLADASWEEGRREFSTLGMTPQALWDATYGALGMVLWVKPHGTGFRLAGAWPGHMVDSSGPEIPLRWQKSRQQTREWLGTPASLTLKGADFITDMTATELLGWLGMGDPAFTEVMREVLPSAEWYDPPESSGTTRVQRGYRKSNGNMVATIEITTGDVEVRETINGQPYFKLWSNVALGMKTTETYYDDLSCPNRPTRQVTRVKAWGFDARTQGSQYGTPGPGLNIVVTVGDLVADEETTESCTYSPQGHQVSRTTSTRRLASMQQQDADLNPQQRGVLEGREYILTSRTEQWTATGSGLWWYNPGVTGQQLIPVYDKVSGEAVRTASVNRANPDPPRLTDQAPPSFECRKCDSKDIHDPTGIILRSGDAGLGEGREVTLEFLQGHELPPVARAMLGNAWNHVRTTLCTPFPLGFMPGMSTSDGKVRETRLSGQGGMVETSLTVAKLDGTLGGPGVASLSGITTNPNQGRAVMLRGTPGGALARITTGWNTGTNQPNWVKGLVVFRTGSPPRPGDELDWVLMNGQREATHAR